MAKRISRVQNVARDFSHESEARLLVKALNDELGPNARGRRDIVDRRALVVLVKRFQAIDAILSDPEVPLFSINDKGFPVDDEDILRRVRPINRFLSRYIAVPVILPDYMMDPTNHPRGFELSWSRTGRNKQPFFELGLVRNIVNLAQAHRISSVKQCDSCRRWLFARFPHQRFCGAECKESFHRSDETDKQRRREWARKNYWIHKNKNTK